MYVRETPGAPSAYPCAEVSRDERLFDLPVRLAACCAVLAHAGAGASSCNRHALPVHLDWVKVDYQLRTRVENVSGKKIAGITFNAAIADATERWHWMYGGYDPSRPLQEWGWNKPIKVGEGKNLWWYGGLDYPHDGGGLLLPTTVLFADGSSWVAAENDTSCGAIWVNSHRKALLKPVDLPLRPPS